MFIVDRVVSSTWEINPSFSFSVVLDDNKRQLSGLFITGLTVLFCFKFEGR
jgi:hypothetical protein